jgi:Tol biopolymer transport system component/DNA-binding winged helix-turn-helix (wHTH) protein
MKAELSCYEFDGVEVRPGTLEVRRAGKTIELEPKAFRVLVHLIEHRDRAVGKEELIREIWAGAAVTDNALTRVIAQLRKELGDDARQPRYIQTLPTHGYRFVAPLTVGSVTTPPNRRKLVYVSAAIGILAAVTAGWWLASRPPARLRAGARPVQLTTSPGFDICGSFSPDGKSVVYSSNRSGWFQLYIRPTDAGGAERQLTDDSLQNVDPAWSPDGQWIAYHSTARHGVWIMAAAGGKPRQVTDFGSYPKWSPDGRLIAFRSAEPFSYAPFDLSGLGESSIWTVAPDGTGLRKLTEPQNPAGQHATPSWSPDGRKVLFAAVWRQGLWAVDVASGEVSRLVARARGQDFSPVLASDGVRVFYTGAAPEGWTIYSMGMGTGAQPVEMYPARQVLPQRLAISPDGRTLAYTQSVATSQLWASPGGGERPGRPIFQDAVLRVKLPVYSPDGRKIAFILQRDGSKQDLWTIDADGSSAKAVASGPGTEEAPQWSASGDLYYTYVDAGGTQLRRIPAGSAESQLVLADAAPFLRSKITADGRQIVYEAGQPSNLWIRAIAGGQPRQLTFDREGVRFPSISPDGQWIAAEVLRGNSSQAGVLSLAGGPIQVMTEGAGHYWPSAWSPDSRRIAMSVFRDGVWNIHWVDRVTRESVQVTRETSFGSYVRSPSWCPTTNEIVYERTQGKGNIYLLDVSGR